MKCPHCPLAGDERPCKAEVTGVIRYCQLVDPAHPSYSPDYARHLRTWGIAGEGPGWLRKVANLAGAATEHVAAGMPQASEATVAARLATCRACPAGYWRTSDETCQHPACGCAMRRKVTWAEQKCPIGLW